MKSTSLAMDLLLTNHVLQRSHPSTNLPVHHLQDGVGDSPRQRIWIAKKCGKCTTGRAMSRQKLITPFSAFKTTKPFSRCKVVGCEKPVSQSKSMIQYICDFMLLGALVVLQRGHRLELAWSRQMDTGSGRGPLCG